eukprot:m.253717 g.253717  ORF g.253717 m.253717 type:complete len:586 (+) comp16163_c0_seq2:110-1867(+)
MRVAGAFLLFALATTACAEQAKIKSEEGNLLLQAEKKVYVGEEGDGYFLTERLQKHETDIADVDTRVTGMDGRVTDFESDSEDLERRIKSVEDLVGGSLADNMTTLIDLVNMVMDKVKSVEVAVGENGERLDLLQDEGAYTLPTWSSREMLTEPVPNNGQTLHIYGRNLLTGGAYVCSFTTKVDGKFVTKSVVGSHTEKGIACDIPVLDTPSSKTFDYTIDLEELHGTSKQTVEFRGADKAVKTISMQAAQPVISVDTLDYGVDSAAKTLEFVVNYTDPDVDDRKNLKLTVTTKDFNTNLIKRKDTPTFDDGHSATITIDVSKLSRTKKYTITLSAADTHTTTTVLFKFEFDQLLDNGWTRIAKIRGSDGSTSSTVAARVQVWQYASKYWTDDKLLNANDKTMNKNNAKYQGFLDKPFSKFKVCSIKNKCYEYHFDRTWDSARAMFAACSGQNGRAPPDCKITAQSEIAELKRGMSDVFELCSGRTGISAGYWYGSRNGQACPRNCPPNDPGFGSIMTDGNRAMLGFGNNLQSQTCSYPDNDGAIGLGLQGQSNQCRCGAGATGYVRAYPSRSCRDCRDAFIYVQ